MTMTEPVGLMSLAEALATYVADQGDEDAIKKIGTFTGAQSDTVKSWISKKLPGGEYLLKLRYMLDELGYRLAEVEATPQTVRAYARSLVFSGLDATAAATILGYQGSNPGGNLLHVLLQRSGGANVTPTKEAHMERIIREEQPAIEAAVQELLREHGRATVQLRAVPALGSAPAASSRDTPPAMAGSRSTEPTAGASPSPDDMNDPMELAERIRWQAQTLLADLQAARTTSYGERVIRLALTDEQRAALKELL